MMKRTVVTRAALSGALVGLALFAAPASAQESTANTLTEQLLTGLGLVTPTAPDIDYRERPPLVVPPTGDALLLPPPRNADAIADNPAWPKDHDEVQRKRVAAEEAVNTTREMTTRKSSSYKTLSPAEMARGGKAGPAQGSGFDYRKTNDSNELSLNELGFKGWGNPEKEKPMVFEGEPDREDLIQPPPGYQTPAPNAPYGVVADRPEDKQWKMPNWFDRTQPN